MTLLTMAPLTLTPISYPYMIAVRNTISHCRTIQLPSILCNIVFRAPSRIVDTDFSQSAPRLRGSTFRTCGPRCASTANSDSQSLMDLVKEKNNQNPVVVYSKSFCPYCGQVKALFEELGVETKIIELDGLVEEQGIQQALFDLTGQTTVPNIFIGGKHIGGCDDTMELNMRGELIPLVVEAGVLVDSS